MERAFWTLVCVAVWAGFIYLMYRGWRNRAARQAAAIGELPAVPQDLGAQLSQPAAGVYVGSTLAPDWQDRIAVGDIGHRASGELTRFERGVLLDRNGASSLWIPAEAIVQVRTARALANKTTGTLGILVIRWRLSPGNENSATVIDTGFRANDKSIYPEWMEWGETAAAALTDGPAASGVGSADDNTNGDRA